MLDSLHAHAPAAHIFILCLSDECYNALAALRYSYVSLIRLSEFEKNNPDLAAVRDSRSTIEYYFTITPCLPLYLLTRHSDLADVTYLDADMEFVASPRPLFDEAGDASVIITPHRYAHNISGWEPYGIYNVSWLTFKNTAEGLACLEWYKASCLEWCYDTIEEGRFADQKYLDEFPLKFSGVHIMQHLGGGVAPWNLHEAELTLKGHTIFIGGQELIFYHAQGMKHIWGPFYASGLSEYKAVNCKAKKFIIKPYILKYSESAQVCHSLLTSKKQWGVRTSNAKKNSFVQICKKIIKEMLHGSLIVQL